MIAAREILPAGTWPLETAVDRIALDYDARHRRRFRYLAENGTEFLLELPRAAVLNDGDGLQLEDGRVVAVVAAPEALVEVTAKNNAELVRLAWHIGNRHLPAQLEAHRILIREDHVIVAMLHGLGARTRAVSVPFTPESGAYAGHAHGARDTSYVFVDAHGR